MQSNVREVFAMNRQERDERRIQMLIDDGSCTWNRLIM